MTRMYLVHTTPVSPGRQKTAFQAVCEDWAADGSFLEVTQGQRESRLELIVLPTLPCPPLRQEQLGLP